MLIVCCCATCHQGPLNMAILCYSERPPLALPEAVPSAQGSACSYRRVLTEVTGGNAEGRFASGKSRAEIYRIKWLD